MPRRRGITADELMTQLRGDGERVAAHALRRAHFEAEANAFRAEEAPLLDDLRKVGWHVDSIWSAKGRREAYPAIVPVLIEHLSRPYSDRTLEGIARALAVVEAAPYAALLLATYRRIEGNSGFKHGLATAVAATSPLEVVAATARDSSLGESRLLLLEPLRRSRSALALRTLEELRTDPDLAKEIEAFFRAKAERKAR